MKKLNIKIPHPLPVDFNLKLKKGYYILKNNDGTFSIDYWIDNEIEFSKYDLRYVLEIVCKLPSCEKLLTILKNYKEN